MARVGWVAAEVEATRPPEWYRITAWDDGWVEVPFFARAAAGARAGLRTVLHIILVLVVGLGAARLLEAALEALSAEYLMALPVTIAAVTWIYVVVRLARLRWTRWVLRQRDADQAIAISDSASVPRRRPGTKLFSIVRSAQQYSDSFTNTRLTRAADIAAIELGRDGADYLATVHLADGAERTYRTADKKLHKIVGHFARPVP